MGEQVRRNILMSMDVRFQYEMTGRGTTTKAVLTTALTALPD